MFTEVPLQSSDYKTRRVRGQFHISFWNTTSFSSMMERAGYSLVKEYSPGEVFLANRGLVTRQIHRVVAASACPSSETNQFWQAGWGA